MHEQTILGDVYAMDSAIIMIITMRWEIQQLHLHIYCMHARTNERKNTFEIYRCAFLNDEWHSQMDITLDQFKTEVFITIA